MAVAETAPWSLREALRPGLAAVRRYWAPFILIQACAVGLVVLYYSLESVRIVADDIGAIKKAWGLDFSAIGGFIAGGLLPEAAKALTGRIRSYDSAWFKNMLYAGFVYVIVAVQVDLFYQLQAVLFGHGIDPVTVGLKLLVDMALFAPFLCMPTGVVLIDWRSHAFRLLPTIRGIHRIWYRERVLPAMIPGWAFWIPFLCAVYALPLALQMPLCLLGEAAWSLLFIFIARQEAE